MAFSWGDVGRGGGGGDSTTDALQLDIGSFSGSIGCSS